MNRNIETKVTYSGRTNERETSDAKKRRYRRIETNIPIHLQISPDGKTVDGKAMNVSLGGAFIHCLAPVKIGQEVQIEIQPNLTQKAVVRWMRGSGTTGIGVEFVDVDPTVLRTLEDLVFQLQETTFSDEAH